MVIAARRIRAAAQTVPPPREAVEAARWLYGLRRRRDAAARRDVFGEPAWDILLDLFVAEADGRTLCVTDVCIGSASSTGTAVRYLDMLERDGRAERIDDLADGRRRFVRLTASGREMMVDLLAPATGRQWPPSGDCAEPMRAVG